MQVGDKKAPAKTKPSPKPTERPTIDNQAEHVGDNTVDLKTQPTPEPAKVPVEATEQPKAAPPPPSPAASAESTEGGDPGRATSAAPAGCRRGAAEAGRGPRSRGEGHHRRVGRRPEREVAG